MRERLNKNSFVNETRVLTLVSFFLICISSSAQTTFTTLISWEGDTSLRFFNNEVILNDSVIFLFSTSTILNKDTSIIFYEGDYVNGTIVTKLNVNGGTEFSKLYENNTYNGFHDGVLELGRTPSSKGVVKNGFIYLPSATLVGLEYGNVDSNSFAISTRLFLLKIDAVTGSVVMDTLLTHYNPYASDVVILDITCIEDTIVLVYHDLFQNTIIIDKINSDLEVVSTLVISSLARVVHARIDSSSGVLISSNYFTNMLASEILSTNNLSALNWYRYLDNLPLSKLKVIDGVFWCLLVNDNGFGGGFESFLYAISIDNGSVLKLIRIDGQLIDFDVKDSIVIAIQKVSNELSNVLKVQTNGQILGSFSIWEDYFVPNQIIFSSSTEWILTGTILKSNLTQQRDKDRLFVMKSSMSVIQGLSPFEMDKLSVLVYPNPTTKNLNIKGIPLGVSGLVVTVSSVEGVVLLQMSNLQAVNGIIENRISVAQLPSGIYYLSIESNDNFFMTTSFVKN